MKIQLTKTTPIPDETWEKSSAHPVQPVATNYAGTVLEVGDELGERLIREGNAVEFGNAAEKPTGGVGIPTDTTGEAIGRTFLRRGSED